MDFSAPYLVVMNKSETIADLAVLPYGSIAISAKEHIGIDELKRAILAKFSDEFIFCTIFVPYTKTNEYAKIKPYLKELRAEFNDDGQILDVVIPAMYAEKFTPYVIERKNV